MTLCTEWLPVEIVDKRMYYPTAQTIQKVKSLYKNYPKWELPFISTYSSPAAPEKKVEVPQVRDVHDNEIEVDNIQAACNEIREALQYFRNHQSLEKVEQAYPRVAEAIKPLCREIKENSRIFEAIGSGKVQVQDMMNRSPLLYKIVKRQYDLSCSKEKITSFIKKREMEKVLNTLQSYTQSDFEEVLAIYFVPRNCEKINEAPRLQMGQMELIHEENEAWKTRQEKYITALQYGHANSIYAYEDMMDILYHFFCIRRERNNINHANDEDTMSTDEVRDLIGKTLSLMEAATPAREE